MPRVPLEDLTKLEARYIGAVRVLSVMMYPDDPEKQNRVRATVAAKDRTRAKRLLEAEFGAESLWAAQALASNTPQFDHLHTIRVLNSFLEESGGPERLADSLPFSQYDEVFLKRSRDWLTAGWILALIRRMDSHHPDLPGGPSVNKAVSIIEKSKRYPLVHRNSNSIRIAWSKYKPVSHFCAAFFDFILDVREDCDSDEEFGEVAPEALIRGFDLFIAEAEAYLDFGLSFRPARAKSKPLLDRKTAFLLPDNQSWPCSISEPAPLSAHLLEAARQYRAPMQF